MTAVELQRVGVDAGPVPSIDLELSGVVVPFARELRAEAGRPHRLYFDLPGTVLAEKVVREHAGRDGLIGIRIGQLDPRTVRVVAELAEPLAFGVEHQGTSIRIRFAAPASRPLGPSAAREPARREIVSPESTARSEQPSTDDAPSTCVADARTDDAVARAQAAGDWLEVVSRYAAHASTIECTGSAATRMAVSEGLRALARAGSSERRAPLASDDGDDAIAGYRRLLDGGLDGPVHDAAAASLARAASARGDQRAMLDAVRALARSESPLFRRAGRVLARQGDLSGSASTR